MVWFGPMRPAAVVVQDSFEALKQLLVRNVKTIGPSQMSDSDAEKVTCHILVLDNPNPARLLTIAGT